MSNYYRVTSPLLRGLQGQALTAETPEPVLNAQEKPDLGGELRMHGVRERKKAERTA